MGDLRIQSSGGARPEQPISQASQVVDLLAASTTKDPDASTAAAIAALFAQIGAMDSSSDLLAAQLQELTKFTDIANELKNILSNLESYDKPTEVFLQKIADLKNGIKESSLPQKVKDELNKNIEKGFDDITKVIDKIKSQYPDRDPLKVIWGLALGQLPAIDNSQTILPTRNTANQKIEVVLPSTVKPDDYIKAFNDFAANSKGKLIDWTGAKISINGNKVTIDYSGCNPTAKFYISNHNEWAVVAPFGGNSNDRGNRGFPDNGSGVDGYNGPGLITQIINRYNDDATKVIVSNTELNTLLSNLNIASTAVSDVSAQTQLQAKQKLTDQQMLFGFVAKIIESLTRLVEKIQSKRT